MGSRGSCRLGAVLIVFGVLELIAVYKHGNTNGPDLSSLRRTQTWQLESLEAGLEIFCVRGHFTRRKTNHGRPVLGVRQSTPCRSMGPVQVSGLRISHKRHQTSGALSFMSFMRPVVPVLVSAAVSGLLHIT